MGVPECIAISLLQGRLHHCGYIATSFDCSGQYFRFLRRKFKVSLDFFVIIIVHVGRPTPTEFITDGDA